MTNIEFHQNELECSFKKIIEFHQHELRCSFTKINEKINAKINKKIGNKKNPKLNNPFKIAITIHSLIKTLKNKK